MAITQKQNISYLKKQFSSAKGSVSSLQLVALHVGIGLSVAVIRPLAWLYFLGTFSFLLYQLFRPNVKPVHILMACAYLAGAEVFLRMTGAFVFSEIGKYSVMFFCLIGMYHHGIKRGAWIYFVFIILMSLSVYITYLNIPIGENFRKTVLFNLSGPLSLGTVAIYCMNRQISFKGLLGILNALVYPIISIAFYIFIRAPKTSEVMEHTGSNFEASGGFGPNQISTILGLGLFVLFVRLLIPYKNHLLKLIMFGMMGIFAFRALVTMSRGGVFTALIMMFVFTLLFLLFSPAKFKAKGIVKLSFLFVGGLVLWSFTVIQTGGLLVNRYQNQDVKGREKDITTGRGDIVAEDLALFNESPVWGVGPGMGKFIRFERTGYLAAAHNEISRMLAEHGVFGVISLLILLLVPGFKFLFKPANLLIIPFVLFWFLTVNHSAMRVASPGVLYAFSLLSVNYAKKKKPSLSRQQTIQ